MNIQNKKTSNLYYTILVLLMMIILTSYLISGLSAKFVTSKGDNSVTVVAKFGLTVSPVTPGKNMFVFDYSNTGQQQKPKTVTYKFKVKPGSEVALKYSVCIVIPKDSYFRLGLKDNEILPKGITMKINTKACSGMKKSETGDAILMFPVECVVPFGDKTEKTYTLKMTVDPALLDMCAVDFNMLVGVEAVQLDTNPKV